MCKDLEKAIIKFQSTVIKEIDRFEGNIYTSSMIPIVLKVQKIFRDYRRTRLIKEQLKKGIQAMLFKR